MSRRLITMVAACAVVFAVGGIAYGAVKIKEFEIKGATELSRDADAMAILNYAAGDDKTIVQIVVSSFVPDLTAEVDGYDVILVSPTHELAATHGAVLGTDKHGHGTLHLTVTDPFAANSDLSDADVYIGFNLSFNPVTRELTGDVRAIGHHPVP